MELSDIGKSNGERGLNYLFNEAIKKITENILDERTSTGDKRKVKIDMTVLPQEDRTVALISYDVTTQTAPLMGGTECMDLIHERTVAEPSQYQAGQVDYRDCLPESQDGYNLPDPDDAEDAEYE